MTRVLTRMALAVVGLALARTSQADPPRVYCPKPSYYRIYETSPYKMVDPFRHRFNGTGTSPYNSVYPFRDRFHENRTSPYNTVYPFRDRFSK
jgi:hypothetical protein